MSSEGSHTCNSEHVCFKNAPSSKDIYLLLQSGDVHIFPLFGNVVRFPAGSGILSSPSRPDQPQSVLQCPGFKRHKWRFTLYASMMWTLGIGIRLHVH
jgi:hypothetical protein